MQRGIQAPGDGRPDKPKTQQGKQADGDDEPSSMKVGMRRPQLAEDVRVVPKADENAGEHEHYEASDRGAEHQRTFVPENGPLPVADAAAALSWPCSMARATAATKLSSTFSTAPSGHVPALLRAMLPDVQRVCTSMR
jgi:hypothetical protein